MEISPLRLAELLFFSFVLGIALGIVNDANRLIRAFCGQRYSKRKFDKLYSFFNIDREAATRRHSMPRKKIAVNVLIFFQDIVFLTVAAFGIIILNYDLNDGKFRIFSVLAAACGFAVYFFTVGKLIVALSEPIVIILKISLTWIFKTIIAPFKFIFELALKLAKKILSLIKKELEKRGNMRYNKIRKREIAALADNGFLS